MAMYQDRIFAFTPKGELIQLPKGATPVDFAYAVHTDLGDQTVGAKINGRVMPLRTPLDNGDQVEILTSKAQHPQPGWLAYLGGYAKFFQNADYSRAAETSKQIEVRLAHDHQTEGAL